MSIKDRLSESRLINAISKSRTVWKEARRLEKENPPQKRSRHELEFLPAAIEVIETPPSPTARVTIWLIISLFIISILWATLSKIDVVITAQGTIEPSGRSKVVQPLDSGVIKAIFVREGQVVSEGDTLIELDVTDAAANLDQLRSSLIQASLDVQRLELLIESPKTALSKFKAPDYAPASMVQTQRDLIRAQASEFSSQLSSLDSAIRRSNAELRAIDADISRLKKTLPLVRQRFEKQQTLSAQGLARQSDTLRIQQELVDTEQSLKAQRFRRKEVLEAISSAKEQRKQAGSEFERMRLTELSQMRERVEGLRQELIKAKQGVGRRTLIAPTSGTVQQLAVTTIGGVVTPAQELMYIVPSDAGLEVDALLANRDRGSVATNDTGAVKVEAYPFTKYGTIPATVKQISADSIDHEKLGPVFKVKATLERSTIEVKGEDVQLSPGMAVTLEIKADERRVISFILTPIIKALSEAGSEK